MARVVVACLVSEPCRRGAKSESDGVRGELLGQSSWYGSDGMAKTVLAPRLAGVAFLAALYVAVVLHGYGDGVVATLLETWPLESRVLLKVAPIASLAWQAHTIGGLPEARAAGLRSYAVDVGAGLGFSLVGDALLQLDDLQQAAAAGGAAAKDPSVYFLCGLASFLVAHVVYIVAFRSRAGGASPGVGVLCGGAAAAMFAVLFPALPPGVLVPAVAVYTTVIATMAYSAATMAAGGDATARALALAGALLFMLSDAVLAARQLGPPWLQAAVGAWHPQTIVMVTYYSAQGLIAASIRVPTAAAGEAAAVAEAPSSAPEALDGEPAAPAATRRRRVPRA